MRYLSRTTPGLVAITKPHHNDQFSRLVDLYQVGRPSRTRPGHRRLVPLGETSYWLDQFRAAYRLDLTKL